MSGLDAVERDLRFALRGLWRRRAFTLAAVLTLGLGLGATTAIFSVVYSVLLKPLPYPSPAELVRIRHPQTGTNPGFDQASSNMYLTYRDENRTFANVGLWQEDSATLTIDGEAERVRALRVTHGTLEALGVPPQRGRWFTEAEHGAAADGSAPVIVSHAFWQRAFGGDERVLGRAISVDSRSGNGTLPLTQPSQVVGILPPGFRFLDLTPQPDVILPVRLDPARQAHGIYYWQMLARLKPGVTLAQAQADLDRMQPIWLDAWPPFPGTDAEQVASLRITPILRPLGDDLVGGVAGTLWVLMGAIGAVLLVACANIANLMLVRVDARRPELATRVALGAVPARIARELLVESACLGAAGTLLGFLLAYVGLRVLVAAGPESLPRLQEIGLYPPVLVFTVVVSLVTTLAFGSITALKHALHSDTQLTSAARGSSASREQGATRNTLVVVQVALALVLVVSSALMTRTFQALRGVEPGFTEAATIQTARIWVPTMTFVDQEQYTRLQREMLDKIQALPGVTSAGFVSELPLEGLASNGPVAVEGRTATTEDVPPSHRWKFVSPGYFETVGTRLIAGRDVTWGDIEAGAVAVISENYAREIAGEPAAAIGKRIRLAFAARDSWREVIGVVQDVREDGVHAPPPSTVYWPMLARNMFNNPITGTPNGAFVIRSERAGTAALMEEVREAVRSVSASIPVAQERTMQSLYASSLARTSFTLVLLGISGAMALTLGVIGIYGVIAYIVAQRTREIGIRAALGARPRTLERMFLRQGLVLTGVGVVVGLVAALGLARVMSSLLFGVSPLDPAAFGVALAVTSLAAAVASYVPARRAAAIDPIETLRAE